MAITEYTIEKNLKRFRGDTFILANFSKMVNGVNQDLNSYQYIFTARTGSITGSVSFTKTWTVSTSTTTVALDLAKTEFNTVGTFYYDIQETNSSGAVTTVFYGIFENLQDITT